MTSTAHVRVYVEIGGKEAVNEIFDLKLHDDSAGSCAADYLREFAEELEQQS